MNNPFIYFGYGFVGSTKNRNEIEIKSTKAYKALRAAFVDNITIEVADPSDTKRWELRRLITNLLEGDIELDGKQAVIVVPSIEALGGNYEDATSTYNFILGLCHIVILNRPDLSTCTMDGTVTVALNNLNGIERLQSEFACAKMTSRGRKALSPNAKFRIVFWAWQNYYIDTEDALDLLGCSRGTLYSLAKEFMTAYSFGGIYVSEYDMLQDYDYKPVRGITLDENTEEVLRSIQRQLGNDWTEEGVSDVLKTIDSNKIKMTAWSDYIRLKLNYQYGRAAMAAASRRYARGEGYVAELKEQLASMG